ncbi:MAG: sortase [Anaerolineales bacterium]|jgi:LPXTG-site transpeptidase (sortase) family protein
MFKLKRSALIATAIVVFISMVLSVTPAQAAAFVVESTADTGGTPASCGVGDGCTLRQAINLANSNGEADTIAFSVSGTITLGDILLINTNITIDGSGQSVTVSGGGSVGMLLFVYGSGDLSIDNLTIANGYVGGGGDGGGIYNRATITSIANTTFSGNRSATGGGGAIYNEGTITTIANTTFSGNRSYAGGGIYNFSGSIGSIDNCTFSGNSSDYVGGAIENNQGTIDTIANSTFSGNTADTDGGVIENYNNSAITTIDNVSFSTNTATDDGGVIFNSNTSTITTIENSTFTDNTASTFDGGAIRNGGTINTIDNSSFSINDATDEGGGIYNSGIIGAITNSTFSGNTAVEGGGINNAVSTSAITTIDNVTFSTNMATVSGGGIYVNGVISIITNSIFSDNTATDSGGGIFNNFGTITSIENSIFSVNSAMNRGGGIYNNETIDTITTSTFSNNTASSLGGGIFNRDTISAITRSTVSGNSANNGGGIYTEGTITVIANSTVSGNTSNDHGGGIYNADTITAIENSTITDNTVGLSARIGGIYNIGASIGTIANTIVAGNERNCSGNAPGTSTNNLTDSTGTCAWGWPTTFLPGTYLGSLADNGGPTQTHALLYTTPANPAIDTGDAATCSAVGNVDQRGVTRPQGWGGCDIGAFEFYSLVTIPAVALLDGSPVAEGASISGDIDILVVTFSQAVYDIAGGSDGSDVTNTGNYLLMRDGTTPIPINFVSYSNDGGTFQAHILVNNSEPLTVGTYTLTVNGETSIRNNDGIRIAGDGATPGTNFVLNFSITGTGGGGGGGGGGVSAGAALPATGFARGMITELPVQPPEKAYTSSDLWMEIPKLGVETDIVGVPTVDGEWDVSWLGNNVGWLEGTAFPTHAGNTGITAHVWDANNNPGPFLNLKQLNHGDAVKIHAWGYVYTYEVRYNYRVRPDNAHVMQHEEYDWITLLTCESYNASMDTYRYRRVVRAVLVDVSSE